MKIKHKILSVVVAGAALITSSTSALAAYYSEIEPNDFYDQTQQALLVGDTLTGYISTSNDKDFFSLYGSGSVAVYLRPAEYLDYDLIVYREDAPGTYTLVGASSNPGYTVDKVVIPSMDSSKRYIVRVMSYGDYSATKPYQIYVENE